MSTSTTTADAAVAPRSEQIARGPITISIMLATLMNALDTTIANVALPHIQGSVSASQDQITWVLTSYIVAAAIMTPMTGWLSGRIGRKLLFLISIVGFTVASMLCGAAQSLFQIVLFRLLQGLFGASLIPISQAVLLDINPVHKHGQAMAVWGMGVMLGPILGPALGGWLTDNFSWRWVFYINLPVGILAFMGVWLFIKENKHDNPKPFDFFGFGTLITFVGAAQMVCDRGPSLDWFSSKEIWTEAIVAIIALYLFLIHTITSEHPFFDRALSRDRNFVVATIFGFALGVLLFSTLALLPPMLQNLMGYPVMTSGLVTMPRGVGTLLSMFVVGRLMGRVDTRIILLVGFSLSAIALWQMTNFSLEMGPMPVVVSGVIQGFGIGLIFVPLSATAFATLNPSLRAEASSVYNLVRNLGSSVGISIMVAMQTYLADVSHADQAAHVDRTNPLIPSILPPGGGPSSLEALNGEITRQATMVSYVDVFRLMVILTLATIPLLVFLKKPKSTKVDPAHAVAD
jgi:DHA2 family multidrug resistance protein